MPSKSGKTLSKELKNRHRYFLTKEDIGRIAENAKFGYPSPLVGAMLLSGRYGND